MHTRLPLFVLAFAALAASAVAADKPEPKQATPEEIKARLAEHALKKAAETKVAEVKPAPKKDATPAPTASPAQDTAAAVAQAPAAPEPPTVLPKVDVRNNRITELDVQLAKQNQEIAREKKNAKPTALDDTLNGAKVSKVLSILGGQSSDDRASVAQERVAMMEEEKELIEAISQAQTKEDKEELQKTLDSMRAMRRELESSLH